MNEMSSVSESACTAASRREEKTKISRRLMHINLPLSWLEGDESGMSRVCYNVDEVIMGEYAVGSKDA
jgi:hypothetical protein